MLVFSITSYFSNILIINFLVLCWYNFGFRLLFNESRCTNQISLETLHSMIHVHYTDFRFFFFFQLIRVHWRGLFAFLGSRYAQILRQMVSLRVKTRSSTNKVDSRHKKGRVPWEDASYPVVRRFSKTTCLLYIYIYIIYYTYILNLYIYIYYILYKLPNMW